jgi:hypothetical protein
MSPWRRSVLSKSQLHHVGLLKGVIIVRLEAGEIPTLEATHRRKATMDTVSRFASHVRFAVDRSRQQSRICSGSARLPLYSDNGRHVRKFGSGRQSSSGGPVGRRGDAFGRSAGRCSLEKQDLETKVETIRQKTRLLEGGTLELINGYVARPEGFEPPTPRSVVWCSVQLSYGRIMNGMRVTTLQWSHTADQAAGEKPYHRQFVISRKPRRSPHASRLMAHAYFLNQGTGSTDRPSLRSSK